MGRHRSDLSSLATESRRHTLTDAGARFVAQVSDPFSDEVQRVVGMPDQTSGQSLVYDVRQEVSIVRPTKNRAGDDTTADEAYDFHVAIMPVCSTNNPGGVTAPARESVYSFGNGGVSDLADVDNWVADGAVIAVNRVPTGEDTFDPSFTNSEYNFVQVPILVDPTTRARVISIAYEVINETEELYKSGAITDYRVDADVQISNINYVSDVGTQYQAALIGNLPPKTLAQAKQVNGVTRAAEEGSLVIGCLDRRDLPATYPRHMTTWLGRSDPDPGLSWTGMMLGPYPTGNGDDTAYSREIPFMQSGSYATGLAGRSKFRLVAHILVEVFPRAGSELMPLAEPAPAYDAMALELLSEIQSATLPGYPVSWNGLGKYTRKLKSIVKQYAPAVLQTASNIAGQMGRPGISSLLGAASVAAGGGKGKNKKKK